MPSRKSPKMPGAHTIGAAISAPRIAGRKITDVRLFLILSQDRFGKIDGGVGS